MQSFVARGIILLTAAVLGIASPVLLHADGLKLVADFKYDYSRNVRTDKASGIFTDGRNSRFSQLYQLDLARLVYPYVKVNLGGYFEKDDTKSDLSIAGMTDSSSDFSERVIRPYAEVKLLNPLYTGSLSYRRSDIESSGSFAAPENLLVNSYSAILNWKPVDLPRVNFSYYHRTAQNDPLTFDATSDSLYLKSIYDYKDFAFRYVYLTQENFDNLTGSGNLNRRHTGDVVFNRGFDYKNNRFNVDAGAVVNYNTAERTGTGSSSTVDAPVSELGSPFYVINDSAPTSNEPFDLTPVDGSTPMTNVNIGRNGGFNPVSVGLGFGTPTEVQTVYIDLSEDQDSFPNLATPSQVSAIADSFTWQFYTSDDPTELNWRSLSISSVTYNSIDNRFEIRLAGPVSARRVKVTTIPRSLVAPGEIRLNSIRALTTLSSDIGQRETLDQRYSFGLGWMPGTKTAINYSTYYRYQTTQPSDTNRTTWNNGLFFRQDLNRIFSMNGGAYFEDRKKTTTTDTEKEQDLLYSLGFKGFYLDTLSQTLTFSRLDNSSSSGGTSISNSAILRTTADLYQGWSANMDLRYSFGTTEEGDDVNAREIRFFTVLSPNARININLDYTITWGESSAQTEISTRQDGTFQLSWYITETLNAFFRYNFRDEKGENVRSDSFREFNINWSPFPEGDVHFAITYSESLDAEDRKVKEITPYLTWRIGLGIFFDLRYSHTTIDDPFTTIDSDGYYTRLRFNY
ncbi:MAG: hypothetical protein OEM01_02545 [Desulfobulbaceae bacterium]|nr:hypothetical protein [Desulfobulbaceae bacterium]